jgi:membrane protein
VLRPIARLTWTAARRLVEHEGLELAGYVAFTALLSLFPFLVFLTALGGFVGDTDALRQLQVSLLDFAPREISGVLRPVILDVLTHRRPDLLTAGIVLSLWTASSGLEALRTLLNRSYGLNETRSTWKLRLQSIVLVVFATCSLIVLSAILLVAPISDLLRHVQTHQRVWAVMRYSSASLLVVLVLIALHVSLPNAPMRPRHVWPGAMITAALWALGAWLFSLYVDHFANYSITYGSLGGIILTLLFFDLAAVIFAYGGELNAAIFAKMCNYRTHDAEYGCSNPRRRNRVAEDH